MFIDVPLAYHHELKMKYEKNHGIGKLFVITYSYEQWMTVAEVFHFLLECLHYPKG